MLKLEAKADLEALHKGNVKEGLKLEYKASDAIDKKSDAKKVEMARDISAFANAEGGQVVYGMTEKEHEPAGLDAGLDPKEYPEIWFEQVLQQHVTPTIAGLRIHHVPTSMKSVAVIIQIPATNGDPHQVSDGKYYRRHNFNRLAMEHYEVRDMFRRATAPSLFVRLSLARGNNAPLDFAQRMERSKPVILKVSVGNRSNQPAFHTQVILGIDERIGILDNRGFTQAPARPEHDDGDQSWLVRLLSSPPDMPIFKEGEVSLTNAGVNLSFPPHNTQYKLTTIVRTPGYSAVERWVLRQEGWLLILEGPH
jgi:Putative DNA-binding domain